MTTERAVVLRIVYLPIELDATLRREAFDSERSVGLVISEAVAAYFAARSSHGMAGPGARHPEERAP